MKPLSTCLLQGASDDVSSPTCAGTRWKVGPGGLRGGTFPGAAFIDLDEWLAGRDRRSRAVTRCPRPRPRPGMTLNGISDTSTVVAYDDAGA